MIIAPALFSFAQLLFSRVAAQATNVTNCIDENSWMHDSVGHTPCFTAAHLYEPCGKRRFLQTIPPGNSYWGPNATNYDPCGCSTAVYMLTSACGACQGRLWVNYTFWSKDCPATMRYQVYPREIPVGVTLPIWATANVSLMAGETFDIAVAKSFALTPSSSSSQVSPTSTPSPPPNPPPGSDASAETVPASSNADTGHSNVGAIAGGVVGALIFLAIGGLLLFWCLLRKRARSARALQAKKALDLSESGHGPLHQDSEKSHYTAAGVQPRNPVGYVAQKPSPPPVSMVGGYSWYSQDPREYHQRHSSSGSGGQSQGYTDTGTGTAFPAPEQPSAPYDTGPAPMYTMHNRQPSVDSFNAHVPISAGFVGGPGRTVPITYGNEKGTVLMPVGYTGAAEAA
ncbi:hypothetical protein NMY22_g6672 [Coprinellus aureogranulatus]|nr:hypothetical protein NMY22_g6672 [Coprinellus aureogranulatus]